jgi:hypothetical protein
MILASLALAAQPVPLPHYRANDAYIWSDGRVERVVKVRRDKVTWSGLSGPSFVRSLNFVMPVESWRSRSGTGSRKAFGKPEALWPVAKPRSVRFRVVAETRVKPNAPLRRSVTMWTCQTMKPRNVRIALGDFATIPFKCDRYSSVNMRLLERLVWDYSPEIGHYVRRALIDYLRGTQRSIDLVAALSGPAASKRRLAALSRAARRGEAVVAAARPTP